MKRSKYIFDFSLWSYTRLGVILVLFNICFISCSKKNDSGYNVFNCDISSHNYLLPPKMASMFYLLPASSNLGVNVNMHSNTGLTETMNIIVYQSQLQNKDWMIQCDTFREYEVDKYMYKSSLYNYNFELAKGYYNFPSDLSTTRVITDGSPFKAVNMDSIYWAIYAPNPMIRFMNDPDSNTKYSSLAHDINWYFRFINRPNNVTHLGQIRLDGKLYSDVYKFRNEEQIQYGNQGYVDYLWIDRDYGLIQFQTPDSTIWNFKF